MKKIIVGTAALALMATAAFAQGANTRQAPTGSPGAPVPDFQQGSGQESGGPAKELNPGLEVPATGSVVPPIDAGTNTRQAPMGTPGAPVPSYQQGSGQESGGPAKELNR